MTRVRIGARSLELGNLDKVLFPDDGITKGQVIDYYREVAEPMLPHLRDRPLTLQRFPDGIGEQGFFQQRRPDHFPDWLGGKELPRADDGEPLNHVICQDEASLAYLADQGVITFHGWLSVTGAPRRPDRLVFDLDPPGDAFETVRRAARRVGALMEQIGLSPWVMTSGSRGLHVVSPLDGGTGYDEVRALARDMAALLVSRHPGELTNEQRKAHRGQRVYLDVLRNAYGQSAVLPYSLRARPGAPAATPLDWDELDTSGLGPDRYGLANLRRRLGQKTDPWRQFGRRRGSARDALSRFADLAAGEG